MTAIKETKALLFADKQSNIKAAKKELLSIHRAIGPVIPSLKKPGTQNLSKKWQKIMVMTSAILTFHFIYFDEQN